MVEIRELSSKREVIAEKRETGIDDNKRNVSGRESWNLWSNQSQ